MRPASRTAWSRRQPTHTYTGPGRGAGYGSLQPRIERGQPRRGRCRCGRFHGLLRSQNDRVEIGRCRGTAAGQRGYTGWPQPVGTEVRPRSQRFQNLDDCSHPPDERKRHVDHQPHTQADRGRPARDRDPDPGSSARVTPVHRCRGQPPVPRLHLRYCRRRGHARMRPGRHAVLSERLRDAQSDGCLHGPAGRTVRRIGSRRECRLPRWTRSRRVRPPHSAIGGVRGDPGGDRHPPSRWR